MHSKFKKVLIKISGEALKGDNQSLDYEKVDAVANVLVQMSNEGILMGVVIGGGNIFRGRSSGNMNRTDADHMGMLATVINALAIKDALIRAGGKACVMSAIDMYQICEPFAQREAIARVDRGEIVIFAAGMGRPYFSTDTTAVLRCMEIEADILLCAKNIDGIYSTDPAKDVHAIRYDNLTYDEIISHNLQAIDQAAMALCRDYKLPLYVFKLDKPEALISAVCGECVGTYISE